MTAADEALIRAERECLGLAIRDPTCREAVLAEVCPEDFHRPAHTIICQAVLDLIDAGKPVDETTVVSHLGSQPAHPDHERSSATLLDRVTGVMYVHDMVWGTAVSDARTAAGHARVVADAARRRDVAGYISRAAQNCANPAVGMAHVEELLREALERSTYRTTAAWPEPMPLSPRLPGLPVEMLPATMRRIIEAVAAATQTAPDLAGFAALATLSAAARGSWEVRITADWREQTVLYLAALSPSGERKSAVLKAVGGALRDLEWRIRAEQAGETAAATARHAVLERRAKAAMDRAAKASPTDYPGAMREAERLYADLQASTPPRAFRITCDDTTPEELARLMAMHGGAMAVLTAEGGLIGNIGGRYSQNGQPNVDLVLKAYNSETYQLDRVTRESFEIRCPRLTLGIFAQPDVIEKALKVEELKERGFFARMLFARPASLLGTRELSAPAIPPDVVDEWRTNVAKVFDAGRDALQDDAPSIIRLDAEASQIFDAWRGPHERRLHPDLGDLAEIRTWGSKLPGAIVRIAALLTLAVHHGTRPRIGGAEMSAAVALAPYLVAHAREVLVGGVRQQHMAAVLVWLRKAHRAATETAKTAEAPNEPWSFSVRDCHRGVDSQAWADRVAPVETVLVDLEDLGYVRRIPTPRSPGRRGRTPSTRYEANPRVLAASVIQLDH